MPVVAEAVNPKQPSKKREAPKTECALQVRAKLVSLNGGVVLAIAIMLTAFSVAAYITEQLVATQTILFGVLAVAAWLYLLDSATEHLSLVGNIIERKSLFTRQTILELDDVDAILLVHEGLNQNIGIESLTVRYADGKTERLSLGPCWRRHELEAFLASVEQAMGDRKLLEEVR